MTSHPYIFFGRSLEKIVGKSMSMVAKRVWLMVSVIEVAKDSDESKRKCTVPVEWLRLDQ